MCLSRQPCYPILISDLAGQMNFFFFCALVSPRSLRWTHHQYEGICPIGFYSTPINVPRFGGAHTSDHGRVSNFTSWNFAHPISGKCRPTSSLHALFATQGFLSVPVDVNALFISDRIIDFTDSILAPPPLFVRSSLITCALAVASTDTPGHHARRGLPS
jgi:hypothetical protein